MVVYYGEKPWDGAKLLHEMLNISPEMEKYVNDYKMLLVEARQNDLTMHNINNVDLFNLLGILSDKGKPLKNARDRAIDYGKEHEIDKSVVITVAGAVNCKIDYNSLEKRGDADMCTVFEELQKKVKIKAGK